MDTSVNSAMHHGAAALNLFLPPVREWFLDALGAPTPPQVMGWPPISRGEHTLILSPTGSGKTMAAFLWGINRLFSEGEATRRAKAVDLLYISPLKALGNDIERNLQTPLRGVRERAAASGVMLPAIRVAVRTGDTPSSVRTSMLRNPPHILITTPESLYIMLTSPSARQMFRQVRAVIVDEIHSLCGNKRGVHLAVSLERLEEMAESPVQRIGLSATQRPLEEVAHFLGGRSWGDGDVLKPRDVTVVDASYQKPLDLKVHGLPDLPEGVKGQLWSALIPQVLDIIRQNRTTLVFCNNRRLAERTADRLNEQLHAEKAEDADTPGGKHEVPKGLGMMGAGSPEGPFYAHHGSISREKRLQLEGDLKAGRLQALVGTSSLELGIDIGSIDAVVQLQAPKGVTQGLQRVGRSGHLVGQTSVGHIFPTHGLDLIEAAVVARGMLDRAVEETHTPQNCLDVLAQQIAAMVAVEPWDVQRLYRVLRRAYPYQDLPWEAYESVLGMLAGKYAEGLGQMLSPRIDWDRVNGTLSPFPGTRTAAVTNGGTITDRGSFGAYLAHRKTRIGDLDEEFVYETRVGDVFMLGSQVWRAVDITNDRVIVEPAPESLPRMPFWRGDYPWRPYSLGVQMAQFQREVVEHLQSGASPEEAFKSTVQWLQQEYPLDSNAARQVAEQVQRQTEATGIAPSENTVVVEMFQDVLGDYRLVVHSPFGGRVNSPWALALASLFRERTGIDPEVQVSDDGILFRLAAFLDELPLDIFQRLSPKQARDLILAELPSSAVFGAQFRQNAARALLLPGRGPRRRSPLWLQRLRAKDLLAAVKRLPDFPIIVETYRDCLTEVMDLPHLEEVLRDIQRGSIRVVPLHTLTPSPVASGLLFDLINTYMYEWDTPKTERQLHTLSVNRDLLADLCRDPAVARLLRPEAVSGVIERVRRLSPERRVRSIEEMAYLLEEQGDLTTDELLERCAGDGGAWLDQLAALERIVPFVVPTSGGQEERWVSVERLPIYRAAFPRENVLSSADARRQILRSFLRHSGPVTLDDIRQRYAFPVDWLERDLERLMSEGEVVKGEFGGDGTIRWCNVRLVEQMHRSTITILRREVRPVPLDHYVYFLTRWQHLRPAELLFGEDGLRQAIDQLQAVPIPGQVWERDVLPARVGHVPVGSLDEMCRREELFWLGAGGADPKRAHFRLLLRGRGSAFLPADETDASLHSYGDEARRVLGFLRSQGNASADDIAEALGLDGQTLWQALLELALAGQISNNSWTTFREIVEGKGATPQQARSTLETQLWERRTRLPRMSRSARHAARRRHIRAAVARPSLAGLWFPRQRFALMGRPVSQVERVRQQVSHLMSLYGIVCANWVRDTGTGWDWPSIARELQTMELRGQVRRGYFVQGLAGMQYVLSETVDRLRHWAGAIEEDSEPIVVNACDPIAIALQSQDGARMEIPSEVLARVPSTYIVLWRGQPALVAESYGARITTAQHSPDVLGLCTKALLSALGVTGEHRWITGRLTVETWNGRSAHEGAGAEVLEALGFRRDYRGMSLSP